MEEYYAYNIIKKLYYPNYIIQDDSKAEEEILHQYIEGNINNKYCSICGELIADDVTICPNCGNEEFSYFSKGLEIPDIMTNLNGVHIYPIVSAKDIDWNNVFLPSSNMNESNWGSFDELRRWGNNKQISINNVYELINVVDYLLCTCEDLWSEINKLKYGDANDNKIWFLINAAESTAIMSFNALTANDFKKENIQANNETKLINEVSYLTPNKYYNTIAGDKFGIGTFFYVENPAEYENYLIRRLVPSTTGRKGYKGYISENQIPNNFIKTKENIDGIIKDIYGYKIGTDLHLFPGFYVDNFIDRTMYTTDYISLIDFTNKKFINDECYFKVAEGLFRKVYCEFLYSDVNLHNPDFGAGSNKNSNLFNYSKPEKFNNKPYIPFILYYIDSTTNKRVVIYISYGTEEKAQGLEKEGITINGKYCGPYTISRNNIISKLEENINGSNSIYVVEADNLTSKYGDVNGSVVEYQNTTFHIPLIYKISDEYTLNFQVITPATSTNSIDNFKETKEQITVHYYKSDNSMKVKVYTDGNNGGIIEKGEDYNSVFNNCISYIPTRYNVPDQTNVNFEITAPWLYDGNNVNELKIDDEFIDYPLYNYEQHYSNYSSYYECLVPNENKRNFEQFVSQESFKNYCEKSRLTDSSGTPFVHVYTKVKDPYKISYKVSANTQVTQEIDNITVNTIVNELNTDFTKLYNSNDYNNIVINYNLPTGVEQVKLELNLNIEETAKVKGSSYILPLNINKMHHPKIYYMSKKIINDEILKYDTDDYKHFYKWTWDNVNKVYTKENVTLGSIYNEINHYGNNYEDIQDIVEKIYGSSISQGNIDEHFYDNTLTDGKDIIISYNQSLPYINLIGTDYLYKENQNNPFNDISIDGVSIHNAYLINVCDLDENFRIHGANSYFTRYFGNNANYQVDINSYYDVINNQSINNSYNLSYFLGVKFDDREGNEKDIQFCGVSYNKADGNKENYYKYDYDYIYNIKPTNKGISEIISDPITIVFKNYENKLQPFKEASNTVNGETKIFPTNQGSPLVSYYVHTSYMVVNSSTFYPPISTRPTIEDSEFGYIYNFNEADDQAKLADYITCWDNVINYHPITLSLKYMENNYRNTPYIYESNEFKMRFNINRSSTQQYKAVLSGTSIPVAVALGQRYYLSDFIEAFVSDDSGQTIKDKISVGSYMYYNKDTNNYNIREIYTNRLSDKGSENNGIGNFLVRGGSIGQSIIDGNPNSTKTNIYYPIPKDEEGNYDYNINYLCAINKLKFPISNNFGINGITVNTNHLQYIDIDDTLINNYISDNDPTGVSVINGFINLLPIEKDINISGLYGNKNYNQTVPKASPFISILPIYRIKRPAEEDPCGINYPTKTFTKGDVIQELEFFKYFAEGTFDRETGTEFKLRDYKTNFKNQINAFIEHKICAESVLNENNSDSAPIVMSSRASEIYIDEGE